MGWCVVALSTRTTPDGKGMREAFLDKVVNVEDSDDAGTSGVAPECVTVRVVNKDVRKTFSTLQATRPMHWAVIREDKHLQLCWTIEVITGRGSYDWAVTLCKRTAVVELCLVFTRALHGNLS
ncbi:hypothetical protein Acr_03g0011790 [Actinidia rufa]|uniref:Uncharacterized protein n=1 Tax=Actinidia rufa TaxID=165716 RepID=A0A7J0ED93_9ERIC|nr:hypothetical protein Acr_03g0011790 [Actinidia rufa]